MNKHYLPNLGENVFQNLEFEEEDSFDLKPIIDLTKSHFQSSNYESKFTV